MYVILKFIKKEIVLSVAIVLAFATCFIVPIDKEYFNYIEWSTIISLFCMLSVVACLKSTG